MPRNRSMISLGVDSSLSPIAASALVASKKPKRYDEALDLLGDFRDRAVRKDGADFGRRLEEFRAGRARMPALIERLHRAGF